VEEVRTLGGTLHGFDNPSSAARDGARLFVLNTSSQSITELPAA